MQFLNTLEGAKTFIINQDKKKNEINKHTNILVGEWDFKVKQKMITKKENTRKRKLILYSEFSNPC